MKTKKILFAFTIALFCFSMHAQEYFKSTTYNQYGKKGLADKNGKIISPPLYDDISAVFHDGLCTVELNEKSGYINIKGELVLPIIYDIAGEFKDGKAFVLINDDFLYINNKGEVISNRYAFKKELSIEIFGSLLTIIVQDNNGLYGFIPFLSEIGREIEPNFYNMIYKVSNDLCIVEKSKKYGFVDLNGFEVIPTIYDYAQPFKDDIAKVRIGTEDFFINKKGEKINKSNEVTPKIDEEFDDSFSDFFKVSPELDKGIEMLEKKDYKNAIIEFDKFIKVNSNPKDGYFYRGKAKYDMKKYEEAITDFNAYFSVEGGLYQGLFIAEDAYFYRGCAKIEIKQKDSGCLDLYKARDLVFDKSKAQDKINQYCK